MSSDVDDMLDRAEAELETLASETDDADAEEVLDTVRTVIEVLDEVEDASEFVDLSELPEAVDFDELVAAIDAGEIPDAIREGDAKEAVQLRQVIRAINLRKLWGNADVRELWRQKQELDDAMDDLGDGEGGSDDIADAVTGLLGDDEDADEGSFLGDDDGGDSLASAGAELEAALGGDGESDEDDDGMVSDLLGDDDSDGETADEDDGMTDWDVDLSPDALAGMGDAPQESKQTAIQGKAMEGIDEFRESLIDVHNELEGIVEENREKARENREGGSSSRNPAAYSTLPAGRSDVGSTERYSTIPRETRHSTAPNRKHVYGHRFSTMRGESDG